MFGYKSFCYIKDLTKLWSGSSIIKDAEYTWSKKIIHTWDYKLQWNVSPGNYLIIYEEAKKWKTRGKPSLNVLKNTSLNLNPRSLWTSVPLNTHCVIPHWKIGQVGFSSWQRQKARRTNKEWGQDTPVVLLLHATEFNHPKREEEAAGGGRSVHVRREGHL